MLPLTWWEKKQYSSTEYGTNLLTNILGADLFISPKSVFLVEDCLKVGAIGEGEICLDFFGGSGTTAHACLNLNRNEGKKVKYILVEQAEYFSSVILPRIKKVSFSDQWKDGKANIGEGSSNFLKYFCFEQFDEAVEHSLYSGDEGDLFRNTKKDPYTQYVFLRDEKQSRVLELDYENDEVNVDLTKLYPDIDLAETLSCVTGKWIKRITKDEVEFADGSKQSLIKPDWRLLKPLIFWGPAE